ncbi:MAG TPA: aspartate--tRNA ligase [Bacteroidales bacterium]|nr:MAG: Aspartate--tRNA ligase [Bacteroidetes bacterium ADurb.Bin037]HPV87668.1 aspartate--tRNA ligase [Bacteroidales bacterium]HPW78044.1 aspartate--tRNA ligase [Bacteroidales bacterium]HQB55264.1 aspartate--tRNA ligase [Bacteroidales bacterium]
MYRTHTCGELDLSYAGRQVQLAGWIQRIRKLGGMTFIDLRDRYGITQLVVKEDSPALVKETTESLGREYVVTVCGTVLERSNKNMNIPTGEIEIALTGIDVLNPSQVPPFTIEEESDGGEELRARYRYLDLRRTPLQKAMMLRHLMAQETRSYLSRCGFLEIETPFLIKSTPEGARDFVVPSRMNQGQFYALPQSPQQFKQLLMIAGYDKYFQIVRCFRDEDLRADRQPEFTQIDCEMSFVERDDVLAQFEGLIRHLFKTVLDIEIPSPLPRITYSMAMEKYGSDKPDMRFEMLIHDLTPLTRDTEFSVFRNADYVGAICVKGAAGYTRKQLDELTEWVKRPQIGASGLVYVRCTAEDDGNLSYKSSVDKFFDRQALEGWAQITGAADGDLLLVLSGPRKKTLEALGSLRLEMGNRLGLRAKDVYAPLWVYDFPLLEWDDETQRFYAKHHPFTAPKPEDLDKFYSDDPRDLEQVNANAYDFVLNGTEVGGGSIRIHDSLMQERMFRVLGMSEEEVNAKFSFIINAFRYGAPPHGGIAFGFDRWCSLFGGSESIRDFIAFPKNNSGRDVMLDAPAEIDAGQKKELGL